MREPTSDPNPPAWAESILRLFLKPGDRDSVSGDLLEGYREMVHAGRDPVAADRWYVRQVAGFLWRATWAWAALLAFLALGRDALDLFVPPASFYTRSVVTTYSHVAIFMAVGFHAAWRARSLAAAAAAALGAQVMATLMIFAGTFVLLGIWHDPQTLSAIERSGGFAELFTLPLIVTGPAVLLSTLGGAAGLILVKSR
jgi:hypothetical protein